MEPVQENKSGVQMNLQFSAAPAVQFFKGNGSSSTSNDEGFAVNLDAAIEYPALNKIINGYLSGKRFEISEGLISSHVVVQQTSVSADGSGNLLVQVFFGGSFNGNLFFKGKPVYDAHLKAIAITGLSYELETGNFLLRMAKSLLQNKIAEELSRRSVFPLQPYFQKAQDAVQEMLNKEWREDIATEGSVSDVELVTINALPQKMQVKGICRGRLVVKIAVKQDFQA